MSKVISIAVGDRVKIEGVGEVELVVVTPEQPKQHPLVGKWVRCVEDTGSGDYLLNKWYLVTGSGAHTVKIKDEKEVFSWSLVGCHVPFDLSNPCDFEPNMPEAINPKFKVGDEVVVVRNGNTFSTYKEAFWFLGLKNRYCNEPFSNNTKAKVLNVCKHQGAPYNLYHLRDEQGNECVIGEEGIKLAGIDKEDWLNASSRLFDSWMKISGGFIPKENDFCYKISYQRHDKKFTFNSSMSNIDCPFNFKTLEQKEQFLRENEKDLLTYFHQL
jgi:hypothetical protein